MAKASLPPYNVGDLRGGLRRTAPAAERNVGPIGDVLAGWLPTAGVVLEVASGTGEHALAFARRFPNLEWQPSDADPVALDSIAAWREGGPANLRPPIALDAANDEWPIERADSILSINMVHISAWASAEGLAAGAGRLLPSGGALILYGPWMVEGEPTAPSNLAFDRDLRARDQRWGLREVGAFARLAERDGLVFDARRTMPSNNLMLRFVRC